MLGIIGGTSLLYAQIPPLEERVVHTPFGNCEVKTGDIAILLRHQRSLPPHRINYRAHLAALALLGVERLVLIGSSGSLKKEIQPGTVMIPTDYFSFAQVPSIHDHALCHVTPGFSPQLLERLRAIVPEARFGGTYVQTPGPRIETKAEVRALSSVGDIVGMTVASEATLAAELGIEVAAFCTVDNYANGLSGETFTYEGLLESSAAFARRNEEILSRIIRGLS